jgi:uncharacterized protein YgbK (DUF1537 family)
MTRPATPDANLSPKIIVLDDDPTGSQTVHSCLLLLKWDVETLRAGLRDSSPIFFVLTNTRALTPTAAEAVTREVCRNLKTAIALESVQEFVVVSRSDSTLRGHYPVETDAIAEELGPFDGHFLVPAFFEGGRITRDSTHYLMVDGEPVPVHTTEFAQDSVFGYRHSYLPDYVAEKTQGRIPADQVVRFTLDKIRQGCQAQLQQLQSNACGVVDGEIQADLAAFAADVTAVAAQGKRFLFRSAASILTALANLPPQPIAAESVGEYRRGDQPGVVLVGSHVQKTSRQLAQLLTRPGVCGIEVEVAKLQADAGASEALKQTVLGQVNGAYAQGQTPVIYTSRQELTFPDAAQRMAFGASVSALLMDIVRGLPGDIGFLISKGGITSNDTLSQGLALTTARLLGQILPGCSIVRTPEDHAQFPLLPVVLFPGNVGDDDALALAYERLSV